MSGRQRGNGGRHDRGRQGHPLVDHRRGGGRGAGRRVGLLPLCTLQVVGQHGESGWLDAVYPLTVDGLIYASSIVLLNDARRGLHQHWLAYCALLAFPSVRSAWSTSPTE